jgi:hypothetical protein
MKWLCSQARKQQTFAKLNANSTSAQPLIHMNWLLPTRSCSEVESSTRTIATTPTLILQHRSSKHRPRSDRYSTARKRMNEMTRLKTILIATLALGANISLANTAPAKPSTTVAAAKAKPAKKVKVSKARSAASIACSAEATKKGIKGKPRVAFRKKCRRAAAKKTPTKKASAKKKRQRRLPLKSLRQRSRLLRRTNDGIR